MKSVLASFKNIALFKVLLNILFAIGIFLVFLSLFGFYSSIRPPKIISGTTPSDFGLEYEQIFFTTADGVRLAGWLIPSRAENAKTIILLHGYPAEKGDILPVLSFLNEKYNLFLFDFRYFGESGGKYSTAGAKETDDLSAAVRFLKSRGIDEVGVWGFSLGGAVALMTAPDHPEIKAVVSDSSYARLDLLVPELYRIPILKYPLAELTRLWGRMFLGINAKEVSPAGSAETLEIPVLIIHSKNDNVIPFKNAVLIQEALKNNPTAEFWFQENLFHGQLDGRYRENIEDFFERNL